ncbi:MAG: hypothetical protein UX16_C0025G0004 [Parcubacteria group bacterium GW2011_GWB1_45_7]|nr:MAG: hypothetical protein UW85_C0025G0003 [Parcubacteria group bacterium GW2011_GWA1_Parcubacteria_45_10]KKU11063.1 MAG: hypothetical protein UX16_C0025G0004 [Parcubacteria group bacterium GW2011_GWB1_45_7]
MFLKEEQMLQTTVKLQAIANEIAGIVAEGEEIIAKAGGTTVGDIERIGEWGHLKNIQRQGGELWVSSLPFAAALCHAKRIKDKELRQAYARDGIFSEQQAGSYDVAGSIRHWENKGFDDYYPIGHLKGMLSALRYVLEKK